MARPERPWHVITIGDRLHNRSPFHIGPAFGHHAMTLPSRSNIAIRSLRIFPKMIAMT
jgi:hypothetical protein